jgi:hypothetical protein
VPAVDETTWSSPSGLQSQGVKCKQRNKNCELQENIIWQARLLPAEGKNSPTVARVLLNEPRDKSFPLQRGRHIRILENGRCPLVRTFGSTRSTQGSQSRRLAKVSEHIINIEARGSTEPMTLARLDMFDSCTDGFTDARGGYQTAAATRTRTAFIGAAAARGGASFTRADAAQVCSNVGFVLDDGKVKCSPTIAARQIVSERW